MNKLAEKNKKMKMEKSGEKSGLLLLLPVLFMTTLFLFCVRASFTISYLNGFFWYEKGEIVGDLYAHFRMKVFVLVTVIFGLYMLFCMFTGKVKMNKHKVYIPMAVYTVFVLISYACSEYKDLALFGAPERYEGTVTLICYMVMLFCSIHAFRSEKDVKLVIKCFSVACLILGLWGILQTFGFRLESIPAWLYIPAAYRDSINMNHQMATSAVNWFFSNQNYSSFFMIFPICLFAMTCIAAEDMKGKVIYAALAGLMLFNLWQSASLGGMVGIAASVLVAVLIAGFDNIAKWKKSLGLLVLAGIISVGASLPVIMQEVQSGTALNRLFGVKEVYADEVSEAPLRFVKIDHVITEGENIIFSFAGHEITIETEDGSIMSITDDTGSALTPDRGLLTAASYIHEESGYPIVEVKTANKTWNFTVVENEAYFLTPSGKGIHLDKVESIGFESNQEFATNRGYLWSRTLPLLKETVLFGKGADTFMIYFPQDDYAGRYNIGYFTEQLNVICDKPHNMYLGVAVNTGVISMLALVVIYVIYLIESVKTYRKHTFDHFKDYIGMGIAVAVAGFMVSGLVNDSTIQMMPVVYVLLGMGFAINRMVAEEKRATEKV